MLRVSLIAIAAVMLAGCDGEEETAVIEETETEAEVAAEEEPAEEVAAVEEEPTEEIAAAEEEPAEAGIEAEETTVLTDESPAVETEIITEPEMQAEQEAGEEQTAEAAPEEGAQAGMATEGEMSEAMQSYRDWVLGSWAEPGNCEAATVVMQEDSMSLPGGVDCENIQVSQAGGDTLEIVGRSCEGADREQVEIQVSQAADGLTFTRDGQQAQLVRCE